MLNFLKSSVAKKFIMGLTGLGLAGFVLAHMSGNLLVFKSPEAYNMYGHMMTHNPAYPLISWGLVAMMVVHAFVGILLTKENKSARSSGYAVQASAAKSVTAASKTMIFSGSILLFFIVSHLATFKYGPHYEITYNGLVVRDLHRLMVECFHSVGFVAWYVVALVILGVHLRHGVSSIFQSLGFNHPRYTPAIKLIGVLYAVVVAAGFISQPIYVYLTH
ncbi:MAG: succinate dehydrogenase cytochrome b subunit [Bdellovibrionota bacterium]